VAAAAAVALAGVVVGAGEAEGMWLWRRAAISGGGGGPWLTRSGRCCSALLLRMLDVIETGRRAAIRSTTAGVGGGVLSFRAGFMALASGW